MIAGHLCSLQQHASGKPAFQLLRRLAEAHGVEMEFNEGQVKLRPGRDNLCAGVVEMGKIVMTMLTVKDQIRTAW